MKSKTNFSEVSHKSALVAPQHVITTPDELSPETEVREELPAMSSMKTIENDAQSPPPTQHHQSLSPTKKCSCDHNNRRNYQQQVNGSYYKSSYYKKNPQAPNHCHGENCGLVFGVTKKVGIKNPIWVCENALKKTHKCGHALCNNCWGSSLKNITNK